jgi:DNA topoisomerase-1
VDNVELMEDLTIKFDFLGKDSIRYENSVQVEEVFYKNVGLFKKAFQNKHKGRRKVDGDDVSSARPSFKEITKKKTQFVS